MYDWCRSHWSQNENKVCNHCKHSGFNHISVFNQDNPITQVDDPALRKEGLANLRLITDRIMLCRMKRDHTSSMELSPKEDHPQRFGKIKRDFSQNHVQYAAKVRHLCSQGVMLNNCASIFGLIMQMRQVANPPALILRKNAEVGQKYHGVLYLRRASRRSYPVSIHITLYGRYHFQVVW
jgi:DNA repair protein RAD16